MESAHNGPHEHVTDYCIVGGGIGGLALALALQRSGRSCRVFERDVSIESRPQGYSITVQQGIRALTELGLAEKIYEFKAKAQAYHTLHFDGTTLACFSGDDPRPGKDFVQRPVPRQEIRKMLFEALSRGTVVWGAEFDKFEDVPSQPLKVWFRNGSLVICKALIGCDGVRSRVRSQLLADAPAYLGVLNILGISKCAHPLLVDRITQTLDGVNRLFTKPFHADSQLNMWQLTFPVSEAELPRYTSMVPQQLLAEAQKRVGHWHVPLPELILTTPLETVRGAPLYDRDPLKTIPIGRVTLLGDACHAMSPFKGQGANQALMDAAQFERSLKAVLKDHAPEYAKICQALQHFANEMLPRSAQKVLASRACVKFYHTPQAVQRDALWTFLQVTSSDEHKQRMQQRVDALNRV